MNRYQYPQLSRPRIHVSNYQDTKKYETEAKLNQVIGDSHDVLARATTVFPFKFYPDTITLDRSKLTITHRGFLNSAEVMSVRVEDILDVTASVGPIFGSLKISSRFFDPVKPHTIYHFWRADALRIKRIVQGYLIARKEGIDCSALNTSELALKLDELGKVSLEEKV